MDVTKKRAMVGIIHCLQMGGAEKMMVTILNHFEHLGYEMHLIIFDNSGEELKALLSPYIVVHDLKIASVMKGMPRCLKAIHTIQPHTVFSGIGHLNIALAPFIPFMRRLLPQTKWIARETNIVTLQNQTSKYPKLFDWLYRRSYSNYNKIIAQSDDMREDLLKNYNITTTMVTINNPVEIEKIQKKATEQSVPLFDAEKINLLSVSGLREEKRHDLMLQVLKKLPEEYTLTVVGAGVKEEALKALSHELKIEHRTHFKGLQSNPYPYMREADLFLLTSEREGFPNVLLEANSLGLPIVAFSCLGGITEIIKEGVNGLFVPFGEIEEMAKSIEEAMSRTFDRVLIQSLTKERYNQTHILERYQTVFES
jgi:glycosyltransferase involved in cell wall biosynthesis